jgi:hypothetical protein
MALPRYLLQAGQRQLKRENIKTEMMRAKAMPRTMFGGSPKMPVGLPSTEKRAINASIIGPTAMIWRVRFLLNSSIISALDLFNSINPSPVLYAGEQLPVNDKPVFHGTTNKFCHSSANSGRLFVALSVLKYNESVKAPDTYLALNLNAKFIPEWA